MDGVASLWFRVSLCLLQRKPVIFAATEEITKKFIFGSESSGSESGGTKSHEELDRFTNETRILMTEERKIKILNPDLLHDVSYIKHDSPKFNS